MWQLTIKRSPDEARTRHQYIELALAGEASHSTDQPGAKVHGQVRLAIISSKLVPENSATSKVEYTNTQQDLPVTGYNIVRQLDMQGFLVCGVCFPKIPLSVDPYFQILLSHILVGLTILNLQLISTQTWQSNHLVNQQYYHHQVPLVTLCDRKY